MKLDYAAGLKMWEVAVHRRNDYRLFLRWVNGFQMQMSFDEFKQRILPQKSEPVEVIYNKVEKILEATINGNL